MSDLRFQLSFSRAQQSDVHGADCESGGKEAHDSRSEVGSDIGCVGHRAVIV